MPDMLYAYQWQLLNTLRAHFISVIIDTMPRFISPCIELTITHVTYYRTYFASWLVPAVLSFARKFISLIECGHDGRQAVR